MTSHLGKKPPIWFHKEDTVVMECPSNALHYRASLIEAAELVRYLNTTSMRLADEYRLLKKLQKDLLISAGEADE